MSEMLLIAFLVSLILSCPVHSKQYTKSQNVDNYQDVNPQSNLEFSFASYYQTNMVLQREPHSSVIWGYGTIGAIVNISVNIQDVYTSKVVEGFDGNGIWSVKIKPQTAGTRTDIYGVQEDRGKLQWILISNVLFGDVFVCSGQSNMEFTMGMVFNSSHELNETVNYPDIRVFTVAEKYSDTPLYDIAAILQSWSIPSRESIGGKDWTYFSAVCWLCGKYLYDELKIPIGLVASTWGGTPIEAWSPPSVLKICHEPPSPKEDIENLGTQADYSQLYNAMIHPLLNMTIKAVIWYQGEEDAVYRSNYYQCMFPNMIKSWRKLWHLGTQMSTDPDLPFGFVQIGCKEEYRPNYPLIRWHQTADYGYVPNPEMKNTFMAVAMDLPDPTSPYSSVHYRDKQDVAARLVAGALSTIYHRTVIYDGPFPEKITETPDHNIVIKYPKYHQLAVTDEGNFQICCRGHNCSVNDTELDKKWHTTVILDHSDHAITLDASLCNHMHLPVDKIRYVWAKTPCAFKKCSVYNTLGYPAAPFFLGVQSDFVD